VPRSRTAAAGAVATEAPALASWLPSIRNPAGATGAWLRAEGMQGSTGGGAGCWPAYPRVARGAASPSAVMMSSQRGP
jgi:hypothetical protein